MTRRSWEIARAVSGPRTQLEASSAPQAISVSNNGWVAASTQPLLLTLMACGADDASSCVLGPLTARAISQLRLVKKFLGVTFRLAQEEGVVRATCLGAGLRNASKGVS